MTAKEATDKNIITKQVVINTPTSARLLPITADEKVIDERQQALTELEELKRDVKRYFELEYRAKIGNGIDDMEAVEYARLSIKLMKVGNEE